MPITFACPHCGHNVNAASASAGRRISCLGCGRAILVPVAPATGQHLAVPHAPEDVATVVPRAPLVPVPRSAPEPAVFDFSAEDEARWSVPPTTHVHVHASRGYSHSLQITSLVLGILSVLFLWLPFVGPAIAALGLLLALLGLSVSSGRRGSAVGFALGGLGLSLIGGAVGGWWTYTAYRGYRAVDTAVKEFNANMEEEVSEPVPKRWIDADKKAAVIGDARVHIVSVKLGGILPDQPGKNHVHVRLRITNTSQTLKLAYRRWGELALFAKDRAVLRDEHGNSYTIVSPSPFDEGASSDTIYPGKHIDQVLTAEAPVDRAERLELLLPASNVGGKGAVGFRIPKAMWTRP